MKHEGDRRPGHIVVVGQWRQGHARLPLPYAEAVTLAGGHPWIFSTFALVPDEPVPESVGVTMGLDVDDMSPLDGAIGLLIPGGGDIDPTLYGHRPHRLTKNVSHRRDRFELNLLDRALAEDMPILAICHGMQLLNVCFGGTLDQNLADKRAKVDHDVGRPSSHPIHSLSVKPDSELHRIMGTTETKVNSHHHQGLDEVAPELEEVGWAEDGVLEAVVSKEHEWVVGVQWHPEVMVGESPEQKRIFESFVGACEAYAVAPSAARATA